MEWTRGPTIGCGSTATVSIATFKNSGEVLAVKSADLHRSEPLQREQRILSSLNCPHIVTYRDYDITRESRNLVFNLFLEFFPRGTLVDEIRRHGGKLEEPAIVCYSRQILRGLDYLHSKGLVHCDVKGQNILIGDDGVKIADFGCAKSAGETRPCGGTPAFMAPEVARGEGQGRPADVWAFGCVMIEMVTGRPPWDVDAGNPVSVLYRIGYSGRLPEIPGNLSGQAKDFLEKCLRRKPEERWTASQLLNHPFLADPTCLTSVQGSESPTSVLDFGFWSSVESSEPENTRNSSRFTWPRGSEEPAVDRIEQIAGPSGRVPERQWDDEDWITVRENFGGFGHDRDHDEHGLVGSVEEMGMGPVGDNKKLDTLGGNVLGLTRTSGEDLSLGSSDIRAIAVNLNFPRHKMESIP